MESLDIGKKGEDVACAFLLSKGHRIVVRNYRMKFGEIDIVSKRKGTFYFVEVKSFYREGEKDPGYRIEERVDRSKLKKLSRVIEHYLLSEQNEKELEWEFWVVVVTLDSMNKKAFVKVIPDVLAG